jgi:hypothetical protein
MGRCILRERDPEVRTLLVAGGRHTRLRGVERGATMAQVLAGSLPVAEGRIEYPRRTRNHARLHRDRDGVFVFQLATATDAVEPSSPST